MKRKKTKISLDNLSLNKETMFNLSNDQMKNMVGGVTEVTNNGCHSLPGDPTGCGTGQGCNTGDYTYGLCSFATNCFSKCEQECTGNTGTMFCTLPDCDTIQDCTFTCPSSAQYC